MVASYKDSIPRPPSTTPPAQRTCIDPVQRQLGSSGIPVRRRTASSSQSLYWPYIFLPPKAFCLEGPLYRDAQEAWLAGNFIYSFLLHTYSRICQKNTLFLSCRSLHCRASGCGVGFMSKDLASGLCMCFGQVQSCFGDKGMTPAAADRLDRRQHQGQLSTSQPRSDNTSRSTNSSNSCNISNRNNRVSSQSNSQSCSAIGDMPAKAHTPFG